MIQNDPATVRTAVEPRRTQILHLIWSRERTVSEIAAALPISIAAVSQHLRRLRDAGLVRVRPDGRRRFYRARREDMGELAVVLESFWSDRLDALDGLARRLEAERTSAPRVTRTAPTDREKTS